jgi:sugar lactone lactonase YvrE
MSTVASLFARTLPLRWAALFGGAIALGAGACDSATAPCVAESGVTSSLTVTIDGPAGAPARVLVTDTTGAVTPLTGSGTVTLPTGPVTVTPRRSRIDGARVGTAYRGRVDMTGSDLCVRSGAESRVRVVYEQDPASNRLYVSDAQGTRIVVLDAPALAMSGSPAPVAVLTSGFTKPGPLAFDLEGNLWIADGGRVVSFAPEALLVSGSPAPRVELTGNDVIGGSVPTVSALAFDANGDLWLAKQAEDRVLRFPAARIAQSGAPTASVRITGSNIEGPKSLAFDGDGNLWVGVAQNDRVLMYAASRLGADTSAPADRRVGGSTPPPVIGTLRGADGLAFDGSNNLWVSYSASNILARYTPAERVPPGGSANVDVTPAVQLTIGVLSLLNGLAFDDVGGLWLPGAMGQLVRLNAGQLTTSGSPAADTTLTPSPLNYVEHVALNPPPTNLPIAL